MTWHERKTHRNGRYYARRHSIAAKAFWNRVKRGYRNVPSVSTDREIQRRFWYTTMMSRGKPGIKDNRERSNILPPSTKNYQKWKRNPLKHDLEGVDTPRKDIKEVHHRGLTIWVGGNKRDETLKVMKKALGSFTDKELASIKYLYVEQLTQLSSPEGEISGQAHIDEFKNKKPAMMLYLPPGKKDNITTVHELTHILRKSQRRIATKKRREEMEAELETVGRIDSTGLKTMLDGKSLGYYNSPYAVLKDRELVTGDLNKSLKGKRLKDSIKKNYEKSELCH